MSGPFPAGIDRQLFGGSHGVTGAVYLTSAYLIGSLCAGYWVVRLLTGQDIRQVGSGNVGARNAGRAAGKAAAVATFVFDFLKGLLVVLAGRLMELPSPWLAGAAVLVIVGHIWPVFLRFRGGKGLASLIGVCAALFVPTGIGHVVLWLGSYALLRRMSFSFLIGFVAVPVTAVLFSADMWIVSGLVVVVALVLFAHRENFAEYLRPRAAAGVSHG